jgi:DTW domain-containing protein
VSGGTAPPTPTLPRKGEGGRKEPASSASQPSLPSPSPLAGEGRGGGNLSAAQPCPDCHKPAALCVCAAIAPIATRTALLILQHPQERDHALGTAAIAHRQFANSRLVVGLSWPSLAAALSRPTVEARRWGVLYLGPLKQTAGAKRVLTAVGPDGAPLADQDHLIAALDGVILLDGSWAQAKALWWRNPWLLKTCRLILAPPRPSLYGVLRKEPRNDSVSTLEAAAWCLAAIADDASIAERALAPLKLLLARHGGAARARTPDRRRHVRR